MPEYDVFLSHDSQDKRAVEELAHRLVKIGLQPWLDKWNLIPGEPWQEAIEEALKQCATCAVFVGLKGTGPWQNEEMRAAIDRRVSESKGEYRVIPVLLPGAKRGQRSQLPAFLVSTTWVEFQDTIDDEDAFHRLVCGIRGVEPGPGPGQAPYEGECPYQGLRFFDVEQAPFFFGREAVVGWLVDRLRGNEHFLAIIGPSGSGKSSLARAGLLAALKQAKITGSEKWPVAICRPGPDPLESLALALDSVSRAGQTPSALRNLIDDMGKDERMLHLTTRSILQDGSPGSCLVLLVDQFEELFTLCRYEDKEKEEKLRQMFVDNLLYAVSVAQGQTIVLVTMRADFYGKCAMYPKLADALSDHSELIGPMKADELRSAIKRPAQLAGLEFEAGLVDTLLESVKNQPGSLPLLQYTLLELWKSRVGRRLTHAAYQKIGGVQGALERHANKVYAGFTEIEQDICRNIFLRLIQFGEDTEVTKRRVAIGKLMPADAEQEEFEGVIHRLADEGARLIVTEGSKKPGAQQFVEIAHEALIQGWSKLREWIDEDRESLRIHGRLTEAAEEWNQNGRNASYLYRGARLAEAMEWVGDINLLEHEFLQASKRAKRRALAITTGGIVLATALVVSIAILAATGQLNKFLYPPLPMEWVTIPAGEFLMGSSDDEVNYVKEKCRSCDISHEQPQHTVYLDAYQIARYEITNKQYHQCVHAGVCASPENTQYNAPEFSEHPVDSVSWEDARIFCTWVGGRLPTEAEWEKAARSLPDDSEIARMYPWGDEWDPQRANVGGQIDETTPVGSYSPVGDSAYGVSDMAGNVWEWVGDWYDPIYYKNSPPANPPGPEEALYRVLRGGSFSHSDIDARSASRLYYPPGSVSANIGFRCARAISP